MTPEHLAAVASALWPSGWKPQLAASLVRPETARHGPVARRKDRRGVGVRLVHAWACGERPVPAWVAGELLRLLEERGAELTGIAADLRRAQAPNADITLADR